MLFYQRPGFQQHLSHSSTNPIGFTHRLETCSSMNLANASTYPSQKQPVQHKPLHVPNQKPAPSTIRKEPIKNRSYIHYATIVQHNYNKRAKHPETTLTISYPNRKPQWKNETEKNSKSSTTASAFALLHFCKIERLDGC